MGLGSGDGSNRNPGWSRHSCKPRHTEERRSACRIVLQCVHLHPGLPHTHRHGAAHLSTTVAQIMLLFTTRAQVQVLVGS